MSNEPSRPEPNDASRTRGRSATGIAVFVVPPACVLAECGVLIALSSAAGWRVAVGYLVLSTLVGVLMAARLWRIVRPPNRSATPMPSQMMLGVAVAILALIPGVVSDVAMLALFVPAVRRSFVRPFEAIDRDLARRESRRKKRPRPRPKPDEDRFVN